MEQSWFPCEPYCKGAALTQCYRCYRYGHVARRCRALQRCDLCAASGHPEAGCRARREYEEKEEEGPAIAPRGVNCSGEYFAWAKDKGVPASG